VSPFGDDDGEMRAPRFIHDDVIEAIVRDRPLDGSHAAHPALVAFAQQVRALGDEPVPPPSSELAALLEGKARPDLGSDDAVLVLGGPGLGGRSERNYRMLGTRKLASVTGKVAGLGLVAKIGLGASVAAAGVVGAGATGMLPASADHAVRGAIEAVTPVKFHDHDQSHNGQKPDDNFGQRVSSDATGESDGDKGVDGHQIADDAPGADHRPGSAAADEPPGQSGDTGLTRANETPAAPYAPDTPPSTTPPQAGGPDDPAHGNTNHTVPSTVPPAAHGAKS
jgi:hypothetical protein